MAVVLVMIAVGFAFSFSAALNLRAARNSREAMRLDNAAASALSHAMMMLVQSNGEDRDTLDAPWAQEDLAVSVDGEEFLLVVEDEERRLNVNLAAWEPSPGEGPDLWPALRRLVIACGGSEHDAAVLRNFASRPLYALAEGEETETRHLPLFSMLRYAPGLSPRIFAEEPGKPAIGSVATAHGGAVNVNTAPEEVLEALWGDAYVARLAVERRKSNDFVDAASVMAFLEDAKASAEAMEMTPALGVSSEHFTVTVRHPGGAGRTWRALVRRSGNGALETLLIVRE